MIGQPETNDHDRIVIGYHKLACIAALFPGIYGVENQIEVNCEAQAKISCLICFHRLEFGITPDSRALTCQIEVPRIEEEGRGTRNGYEACEGSKGRSGEALRGSNRGSTGSRRAPDALRG